MKNKKYHLLRLSLLVSAILLSFKIQDDKKIKIYLIGDSTMSVKDISKYPETGWGMPFTYFFDQSVIVDNRAQNGRSTRSFMNEGLWKEVTDSLNAGDYVFIQFGHNDEVKTKPTYTTEAEFKSNLLQYVSETIKAKATPILLTPVARRSFDANGKVRDTHELYSQIVRDVAREKSTPLIDLDRRSMALLQQFGVENSKFLFNKLDPGQNPNYPAGVDDNTHFNELGARRIAELVLLEIKRIRPELAGRIVRH